jgi:hypothetical protein
MGWICSNLIQQIIHHQRRRLSHRLGRDATVPCLEAHAQSLESQLGKRILMAPAHWSPSANRAPD